MTASRAAPTLLASLHGDRRRRPSELPGRARGANGSRRAGARVVGVLVVADLGVVVGADLMTGDTMDADVWAEMMRINVTGTGPVIRESLPALLASGGGSIVTVSSLAAWQRDAALTAYASSKIALHALTRHTACAWGTKNVRCNTVAPGSCFTENVRGGTAAEVVRLCWRRPFSRAWASPRTLPPCSPSSCPTSPAGSPVRSSRSTEA
ncbi:SDR family oxidoreductase [Rhodococcus sp. WS4]|nr:SDR family oxidoreductase [Rhodococcus sp. WS4]